MTLQEQLAHSGHSAKSQSVLPFADLLLSTGTMNTGQLGNASAQVVRYSSVDVDSVMATYHRILNGAQPSFKLAILKRQKFTSERRRARIQESLAALSGPQPTDLSLAQWKAILEEVEDED